jgi:hypothetical protein
VADPPASARPGTGPPRRAPGPGRTRDAVSLVAPLSGGNTGGDPAAEPGEAHMDTRRPRVPPAVAAAAGPPVLLGPRLLTASPARTPGGYR